MKIISNITSSVLLMASVTVVAACSSVFQDKASIRNAETARNVVDQPSEDANASPKVKKSVELPVALIGRADTEMQLNGDIAEMSLKMTGGKGSESSVASQSDYPTKAISLRQGYVGSNQTDTFSQDLRNTKLDIVAVIDNSGSMAEEQAKVSTQLPVLLNKVQGTDWRVAIVNTDVNSAIPCAVIRSTDTYPKTDAGKTYASAQDEFKARVLAQGISGSGNEEGLVMATKAWGSKCPANWYRSDSALATLIVSDEDECSNGLCDPNKLRPAQLAAVYEALGRVTGKSARTYSIHYLPSHTAAMCPSGAYKGVIYEKAVVDHGGTSGSICDATYDMTFQKISDNLSIVLKSQFKLKFVPDMVVFEVKVGNMLVTADKYELSGDLLTFKPGHVPAEGAAVTVSYTYGSVTPKKEFALGAGVRFDDAQVLVNDVKLENAAADALKYQLIQEGANAKLVFNVNPPDNADIKAILKEDVPLSKVFGIGANVVPGTVDATVNGIKAASLDFSVDYVKGTVTFNVAPARLSLLNFNFMRVMAPDLEYPFALVEGASLPEVRDAQTGDLLVVTFRDGKLIFNEEDFRPGRDLKISYMFRTAAGQSINLPYEPIAESVSIKGEGIECSAGSGQLTVVGNVIKISGDCDLSSGLIKISGDFVIERYKTFLVEGLKSRDVIKVSVDKQEVNNFKREGQTLQFDVSPGSSAYSILRIDIIE